MSHKLRKQIHVDLEQLDSLMKRHPRLLRKGRTDKLTEVEIDALAALLHSFYTGVENIFKRVSVILDDGPPTGEMWHIQLLNSMTQPNKSRNAVISQDLHMVLRRLL